MAKLHPQEAQRCALLQKEFTREPTERRLTVDRDLVRADQVALHAPRSDEPVQPPKGRVRGRKLCLRVVCHDAFCHCRCLSSVSRSDLAALDIPGRDSPRVLQREPGLPSVSLNIDHHPNGM
jgi:hypothetical protein